MSKAIPLLTLEARLKRELRAHLRQIGFQKDSQGNLLLPDNSKETIRALHHAQSVHRFYQESSFIEKELPKLKNYFAHGREIHVKNITPRLELIEADSWQSRLFRLASLTWSVPVSQGYGRRMRFLVWDDDNQKLMGIIALGDPVFNLKVRDELIGWTAQDRKARLVDILDSYVLGALPPYNMLLGGKLIACLIRTQEIKDCFARRYGQTVGIISKQAKKASLVMVTTTSALGKSSVYNRLSLNSVPYFKSIGFTNGWGHFHIPDQVFDLVRHYLERKEHRYAANHQFGEGPNWRIRAIREALKLLGMNQNLLRHGIQREVFICNLASNSIEILTGAKKKPLYPDLLSIDQVAELAKERWLIPRSQSRKEYKYWKREQFITQLIQHETTPISLRKKLCL